MPDAVLEYAIRRLNWRRTHYGIVRMPGAVTQAILPMLEEAEADRSRREAEVRQRVANPFICGPSHAARSRLPEPIFADWLRDASIEPPVAQVQAVNWTEWWEQTHKGLAPEQVAHVWAGLDRVRFFEVVARPAGSVGYAVVKIEWEYNDDWYEPGAEGGTPLNVFRTRAAAEALWRQLEQQERADYVLDPDDPLQSEPSGVRFETTRWSADVLWPMGLAREGLLHYEYATFAQGDTAPFYDIVEVDLLGIRAGDVGG
ncbi:hypothetical protein R5W23_005232 [Gemmata sp. JC673]|uniref:DUF3298 domain-containing protein n=1 Tax=Gemmata algarum TaxID=2975278 RepID=A0ABU5F7N9_9BACT|nr:hypothetical protein [Gemmata algarum]MDY3563616.1 hypothetical protein [Gemmata algarum]